MHQLKAWLKAGKSPLARKLYRLAKARHRLAVPVIPALHRPLYACWHGARQFAGELLRMAVWTPLFQSRLLDPAPGLVLSSGLPMVLGPLNIRIGENCQLSGISTLTGRTCSDPQPELIIGDRVVLNWQTTMAVGSRIVIGDDVMMGGRNYLAGYPGHPLDPRDRAAGLPDTHDQVGDIVIRDGVWLGMGVTVTAGVTIGEGTVVAAGSVVTKDLPPGVLAGGMPAKVIRQIHSSSLPVAAE